MFNFLAKFQAFTKLFVKLKNKVTKWSTLNLALNRLMLWKVFMPISITLNKDGYYEHKWTGAITKCELLNTYRQFYQKGRWLEGTPSLINLLDANMSLIDTETLHELAEFTNVFFLLNKVKPNKTAVVVRDETSIDIARYYKKISTKSLDITFFTPIHLEALMWIKKSNNVNLVNA